MFKFKWDTSDLNADEFIKGVEQSLSMTLDRFRENMKSEGERLAGTKLRNGLQHWVNGFRISPVHNGEYFVVELRGTLAGWMEDGSRSNEVVNSILNGFRAKYNKENGQKYVDVPLGLATNAGQVSMGKGQSISVASFKDSASLSNFLSSQLGKGGRQKIVPKQAMNRRSSADSGVIESTPVGGGKTSYLAIKRVNSETVWKDIKGAHVFEDLASYFETEFPKLLSEVL